MIERKIERKKKIQKEKGKKKVKCAHRRKNNQKGKIKKT